MAFVHGKNSKLWVDGYELTKYFQEFDMAAKAGVTDTTVFGTGAKTYIGGLNEGTLTGKGFFGASASDVEDSELSAALGRQNNTAITLAPSGLLGSGASTRCVVAYGAETDYSVSAMVTDAVKISATFQADSGLKSGVIVYDPTNTPVISYGANPGTTTSAAGLAPGTPLGYVNDASLTDITFTATAAQTITTITSGSGLITSGTITAGTPQVGTIAVETNNGQATFTYTSWSTTTFFGLVQITSLSGASTVNTTAGGISLPNVTSNGAVCNLHLFNFTDGGSGLGGAQIFVEESDDGTTWVQLCEFGPTPGSVNTFSSGSIGSGTVGLPGTGGEIIAWNGSSGVNPAGGYTAIVARGTPISRFLRWKLIMTSHGGGTPSLSFGISVARQ